jgi:threonine dehydrogenase-like Zn-dependent dehydrogenase
VPETMKSFVIKKIGETEVVEKPIPEPGPEEAIVRTTAALICTSDVHTVKGALPVPDGRTLGHESVGVIHKLGSAVTGFERMKRLLRLLESGRIDPTPMTTHTFGFDRIGEAFEMMTTKADGIVKPLITFP